MSWKIILAICIFIVIVIFILSTQPTMENHYLKSSGIADEEFDKALHKANNNSTVDRSLRAVMIDTNVMRQDNLLSFDDMASFQTIAMMDFLSAIHEPIIETIRGNLLDTFIDFTIFNNIDVNVDDAIGNEINERKENAEGDPHLYLQSSVIHTNDPENSHDASVNMCMRAIIKRLKDEITNISTYDSIKDDIIVHGKKYSDGNIEHLRKAVESLKVIEQNNIIISLDTTDLNVLCLVWSRANDYKNGANRDNIKQAIFDALVDCWKGSESIVCANGRASRIIGALVLLDHDERNWEIEKIENYKNEIFNETRIIIQNEAIKASTSDDIKMINVGKSYMENAPDIETDAETELLFIDATNKKIVEMIDFKYATNIPVRLLDKIKREACAAL